jgi:hypothetical protein
MDNEKDKENKDDGVKDYIEKIILNKQLEKELKETGSPYKIPETPKPGEDKGENTTKKL